MSPRYALLALLTLLSGALGVSAATKQPNVIIVMTDDQGYGELSAHGNPVIRTPNLDRLHDESIRLTDFHVAPMCTPTRGQLMTGVDAIRNGAMNVSSGRTLLRREFPTMAQIFRESGYHTGIFGKWHLGDNYPYRPQDRGFEETLWFPSSHINSLPDHWDNDYFDDTYFRNGSRKAYTGYTTDVFFREAMQWMQQTAKEQQPFFCYLPTAAPHSPHFVPSEYRERVAARLAKVEATLPKLEPGPKEQLIRFLAMIENIDENMGKLEAFLQKNGLRENTLIIFISDNGSTMGPKYYNAGMKGGKVTLWEGGHRVPCFVRWPEGQLRSPGEVKGLTQVQDILPTLIDLCSLKQPVQARFDGISLADVLRGKTTPPEDRMLVINYSRMPFGAKRPHVNSPATVRKEGAAVLWKNWRLLEDKALYDLEADPLQESNVITKHQLVAERMRKHLNRWWDGVKDRANTFEAVSIGAEQDNPTLLTACEWADVFVDQQQQVRRADLKNGVWHIEVAREGEYAFELRRWPTEAGLALSAGLPETKVTDGVLMAGKALPIAQARLQIGAFDQQATVKPDDKAVRFTVQLKPGKTTMQTWFSDAAGKEICGAYYVYVQRK